MSTREYMNIIMFSPLQAAKSTVIFANFNFSLLKLSLIPKLKSILMFRASSTEELKLVNSIARIFSRKKGMFLMGRKKYKLKRFQLLISFTKRNRIPHKLSKLAKLESTTESKETIFSLLFITPCSIQEKHLSKQFVRISEEQQQLWQAPSMRKQLGLQLKHDPLLGLQAVQLWLQDIQVFAFLSQQNIDLQEMELPLPPPRKLLSFVNRLALLNIFNVEFSPIQRSRPKLLLSLVMFSLQLAYMILQSLSMLYMMMLPSSSEATKREE